MMWRTHDRQHLLRYLGGELSPHETAEWDARLLSDDVFLDQLEEAWSDALDAYAAGELGLQQRELVERILRQAPTQTSRLQVARAMLRERQISNPDARAAAKSSGRGLFWRASLAVICVAIAVAAIFYLRSNSQTKNPLTGTQNMAPSALPGPKDHPAQPSQSASSSQPAFALLLGTGVERGSSSIRTVTLPHGLQAITVQILLPAQELSTRFEVQVIAPPQSAVETVSGLVARKMFSHRLVEFTLPARDLYSGLYTFRVYREGNSNKTLVASYQAVITRN